MKTCRVIRPPSQDPCGQPATCEVEFTDETRAPACNDCRVYLEQTARSHGTMIAARKLTD